jgi:hypothetical protein
MVALANLSYAEIEQLALLLRGGGETNLVLAFYKASEPIGLWHRLVLGDLTELRDWAYEGDNSLSVVQWEVSVEGV